MKMAPKLPLFSNANDQVTRPLLLYVIIHLSSSCFTIWNLLKPFVHRDSHRDDNTESWSRPLKCKTYYFITLSWTNKKEVEPYIDICLKNVFKLFCFMEWEGFFAKENVRDLFFLLESRAVTQTSLARTSCRIEIDAGNKTPEFFFFFSFLWTRWEPRPQRTGWIGARRKNKIPIPRDSACPLRSACR